MLPIMVLSLSGCTSAIFNRFDAMGGNSVTMDARQRAIVILENQTGKKIACAEPSPDALSALGASLSASGDYKGEVSAKLSSAISESVKGLGLRSNTIQLLRDGLYRACEAYANGALSEFEYGLTAAKYGDVMVTLLAIEQLTSLNLEVTERPVSVDSLASESSKLAKISKTTINESAPRAATSTSNPNSTEYRRHQLTDESIEVISAAVTNMVRLVLSKDNRQNTCLSWFAGYQTGAFSMNFLSTQKSVVEAMDRSIYSKLLGGLRLTPSEPSVQTTDRILKNEEIKLNKMQSYCDKVFIEEKAFLKSLTENIR